MKNLLFLITSLFISVAFVKAQTPWVTNGNKIYYSGGNVGINSSNPPNLLTIKALADGTNPLAIQTAGSATRYYIKIESDGDGVMYMRSGNGSNRIRIHTNNFTYFNGGNVGFRTATSYGYGVHLFQASNNTSNNYRFFQGTGTYGIRIGNGTSSGFMPTMWGLPEDSNDKFLLLAEIDDSDDTGTTPTFQITSRNRSNNSILNRPIFAVLNDGSTKMTIASDGNVGIGNTDPSEKLVVNGKILAEEVKVEAVPSSDFVFESDYSLRSISEVESFVKENKHLPDIPSAQEFKENGVGLGEMDNMLLRKIEELTLYIIQLKGQNDDLYEVNKDLINRIEILEHKN